MVVTDLFFTYFRPQILIHLYRQIVIICLEINRYYYTSDPNQIITSMNFIVIIIVYTIIDFRLQKLEEYNQIKDAKYVNIMDDMKKPIGELLKLTNNKDTTYEESKNLMITSIE